MNVKIDEKFQIVKAAKARPNAVPKLAVDNWKNILEIIKNDVDKKTDKVTADTKLRRSTIGSRALTTTFPNTCTVAMSFKNNRIKSKRIAAEVYMVSAETEEFIVEQQEADATALTGPPKHQEQR